MNTKYDLDHIFTYHRPTEEQIPKYEAIRTAAKVYATALLEHTPSGADQDYALRLVMDSAMIANAAVARGGKLLKSEVIEARMWDVFAAPKAAGKQVDEIYMHTRDIDVLSATDHFDFHTHDTTVSRPGFQSPLLLRGFMWGANVIQDSSCPPGHYALLLKDDVPGKDVIYSPLG